MARRGSVLLYTTFLVILLVLFGSLAVDYGRVQAAKSELQAASDAAVRYAAMGMRSEMESTSGAAANAAAVFAANRVDGQPAPFDSNADMQLGIWVPQTNTFTVATLAAGANAVRLTPKLMMGDSVHPLTFLSLFGKTVTIHAESIAMVNGQDATTYVSAKGNPWLAGMPAGSVSSNFRTNPAEKDYAGTSPNDLSSPALISLSTLNVSAGDSITFDGVTGGANFGPGAVTVNADGDPTRVINLGSPYFGSSENFSSPMNGMSNCRAPINAVMAVFLDDSAPTSSPAPSTNLDYGTPESRDYVSVSPLLKQVFFVGDGRRSNGEIQQIVVPAGAKRILIANMDGWQYNDNLGGYNLTIHATQTVSTVRMK